MVRNRSNPTMVQIQKTARKGFTATKNRCKGNLWKGAVGTSWKIA
jgi:hypothetical protein